MSIYNTPPHLFSFKSDNIIKCRVCHVYDGDTIHIVINYKNDIIRIVCILYGIDTPEIVSVDNKVKAYAARNRLIQLVTDWTDIELSNMESSRNHLFNDIISKNQKIIDVLLMDSDKYGRVLCNLYVDGQDINKILLNEGYCYEYFGGTKHK